MREPENACRIINGVPYCSDHSGCMGAPCTHYVRVDIAQTTVARRVGCAFLRWGYRCACMEAIEDALNKQLESVTI